MVSFGHFSKGACKIESMGTLLETQDGSSKASLCGAAGADHVAYKASGATARRITDGGGVAAMGGEADAIYGEEHAS